MVTDYKRIIEKIRENLENYIVENKLQSLVLGVSGGIDSTLVAALAKPVCNKLNIPLIGRSLPASTNAGEEISRAALVGRVFCDSFKEVNINDKFIELAYMVDEAPDYGHPHVKERAIQNGNIKARIRMIYLYDLASVNQGLVLSTDNYTEYLLGFWTLHGDVGDYGMIQELWKTEVYEMAEWIAENECKFIDESEAIRMCIDAAATDGLGISTTDLEQILPDWKGSSRDGYKEVDLILKKWEARSLLTKKQRFVIENKFKDHPVIQRHLKSEYKRNNPTNISRKELLK